MFLTKFHKSTSIIKRIFYFQQYFKNSQAQQNLHNQTKVSSQQIRTFAFNIPIYNFGSQQHSENISEDTGLKKFFTNNQILVEQKKYEEAIKEWVEMKQNQTIKGIPNEECDFQIAKIYLSKGDIQESKQLFYDYLDQLLKLNSLNQQGIAEESLNIAQEFQQENQYEEANSFYQKSMKLNNDNIDCHLGYADNLIRNMNLNEQAIDHIYKIINHNKLYTPMYFQLLGEAYFNKREYKQSIEYFLKYLDEIINTNTQASQTQEQQNQTQGKQKLTKEEAIEQQLKKRNLEVAAILLKVASSYYYEKNYEKSLEFYLKNYEFQQENEFEISHQMYLNISELYIKLQNMEKGLYFLQKAQEQYPEIAQFSFLQGMVYLNYMNDLQKAQSCFEKTIQISPKSLEFHKQLGLLYLRQSKYEEAEEMFLKCLSIFHNDTDSLYYMAYILQYYHNSPKDALICYQLCLDINSELAAPNMQMAIIHFELKNQDRAVEYITKAYQSDPDSKEIKTLYERINKQQTSN